MCMFLMLPFNKLSTRVGEIIFPHDSNFSYVNHISNTNPTNNMGLYFKNLYNFSPENSYYSYAYVSLIQCLSYYDTFYNDSIIPECYERKQENATNWATARSISPGVVRQTYPYATAELREFIDENKDYDYQMRLIDKGTFYAQPGINPIFAISYISMKEYNALFQEIDELNDLTYNYMSINTYEEGTDIDDPSTMAEFDYYVKMHLNAGEPVILHIKEYNERYDRYENYHSVVAYYYNEEGIHANFGYGQDSTDVIVSYPFFITDAGVIDVSSIPEIHSNNYVVNGYPYCGCGENMHDHNFSDHYGLQPRNSSVHRAYCECGEYNLRPHTVMHDDITIIDRNRYANCIECGALVNLDLNIVITYSNSNIMYTENGSYISPNGTLVLSREDLDNYYNDNLVFENEGGELI